MNPLTQLRAFIAGFVSTLVFHQGLLWLLYVGGISPRAPWNMTPVPPLHLPAVMSLAFWGGLWGVAVWALIRSSHGGTYWGRALLIGALAPSLVAWFVVMPLKRMGMAGSWDSSIIIGALLLNGSWGLGVALLMRALNRV
jgi:hypothetical protein